MSDTPRVDAYSASVWKDSIDQQVIDFARTLERELLATQARERVLRSALEQVKGGLCYPDEYYKVATQALNHP